MKFAIFLLAGLSFAQVNSGIRYVSTTPSGACSANAQLRLKTPGGALYSCQSGTWTSLGGGSTGSGTVNSGTIGQLGYYAATGTAISPTGSTLVFNPNVITPTAAPSLVKVGAGTGTTWGYKLVCGILGSSPVALGTAPTSETTISGNATLDGTHSISVTAPSLSGTGLTSCDVYRTTAGGTPSTTGLIGNVASAGTLSDTGLTASAAYTSPPSSDYSQGSGSNLPYVNTSNGSAFGCKAFADNSSWFPLPGASDGLGVLVAASCGQSYAAFLMHFEMDTNIGGPILGAEHEIRLAPSVTTADNLIANLGDIYIDGHASGGLTGMYGAVSINSGGVSDGIARAFYGSVAISGTNNGDIQVYYVNGFLGGTNNGKFIGYFNENLTAFAGVGKAFSWYSAGGAGHFETGSDATVGVEIERHSGSQSADLFKLLDSDGTTVLSKFTASGGLSAPTYSTITNCANAASPAACGSAAAGAVAIPTGVTSVTLVVNTSAVTANSEIRLQSDDSLTIAATTCNSTLATLTGGLVVTARNPGTSFTITYNGTIATNPLCVSYTIVN